MARKMGCWGFGVKGSPLSTTKEGAHVEHTLSGYTVNEGEESVPLVSLKQKVSKQ